MRGSFRVVVLFVLALLPGCKLARFLGIGGDDPQWQTETFDHLHRRDVLQLARREIGREYQIVSLDAFAGELTTDWKDGLYSEMTRQDLRQRVLVEVERLEDGVVEMRLRVQCEVNDEPGRHLDPSQAEWTPYDDDVTKAKVLMRQIKHVAESARPR